MESQAAPNKKGKGQRKGAVSNKIALLVVAAMLAAVYLYIEIKKGTNGTGFKSLRYAGVVGSTPIGHRRRSDACRPSH